MRRRVAAVAAGLLLVFTAGCADWQPSAQDKENAQQRKASDTMVTGQPIEVYPYSVLKAQLNQIRGMEAKGGPSTTFEFLEGVNHPIMHCSSIGMPIPANTSLSNPHQVVNAPYQGSQVIDQMEPTGVYPSPSANGTYVICLEPDGTGRGSYWEGHVKAVAGAAHWDDNTHEIVVTGEPGTHFSTHCDIKHDGSGNDVPVCN